MEHNKIVGQKLARDTERYQDQRIPRVCQAVIKAKSGYLKNLKYILNFFGYMIPYVLFHSFDVFTIILRCRK